MAEIIGPRLYSCCNCKNEVALHDDIISKAFQVRNFGIFSFRFELYECEYFIKHMVIVYCWPEMNLSGETCSVSIHLADPSLFGIEA